MKRRETHSTTAPTQRRMQFRLRTLFVVMLLCGLPLGWLGLGMGRIRKHGAEVHRLQEFGARVFSTSEYRLLLPMSAPATTVSFPMKSEFGDEDILRLSRLSGLSGLDLTNTQVTDNGLAALPELQELEGLILNRTGITDAGLQYVGRLTKLKVLSLSGTPVTDQGLVYLTPLTELRMLCLADTSVTGEGVEMIRQTVRNKKVNLIGWPMGEYRQCEKKLLQRQVEILAAALDAYKSDVGEYPQRLTGLVERADGPQDSWNGPYIIADALPPFVAEAEEHGHNVQQATDPQSLLDDVWGRPYRYELNELGTSFRIWTCGPDVVDGTADDVSFP